MAFELGAQKRDAAFSSSDLRNSDERMSFCVILVSKNLWENIISYVMAAMAAIDWKDLNSEWT